MKIGLVQMNICQDKAANLAFIDEAVKKLARGQADLVCLPEMFNYLGSDEEMRQQAEALSGPSLTFLRQLAVRYGIFVHGGSILERHGERIYNTTVVFGRQGDQVALYRKLHLFDVEVPGGTTYRESAVVTPGREICTFECEGITVGLAICYDLRFPELFRELAARGAEVVLLPAVFNLMTGKDHWEVLVRARAIENQCYVAAIGNWGWCPPKYSSWGRSMVVNPWGTIMVQAPDQATTVSCELDFSLLREIRAALPALRHRRHDLFP